MELITILSTIILIATISTFILSIGAYILYKIRSRREQKPVLRLEETPEAELITVDNINVEDLQSKVIKRTNPKIQFGSSNSDDVKPPKRIVKNQEKFEGGRIQSSRYTKYSAEKLSQNDNDNPAGDLLWR